MKPEIRDALAKSFGPEAVRQDRRNLPKSPEHRAKLAASNRATKRERGPTALQRFAELCHTDEETGCWEWDASKDEDGYALFSAGGRTVRAFRWIYQQMIAAIPAHLVPDHKCRNRGCVNPAHADIVTNQINVLRGDGPAAKNARKTHCEQGHEFTPENTYLHQGRRHCRACRRIAALASYHRNKGQAA